MHWAWTGGVALATFAVTLVLTGRVRLWLERRAILDHPVERSSHRQPVPRGGGLAVLPVLLAAWLVLAWRGAPSGTPLIAGLAAALAVLSWRDDRGGLPVTVRLAAHAVAVAAGLAAVPPLFGGALPYALDRVIAGLLWLWFVELFNFMDGIDGITAVETAMIGGGMALLLGLAPGAVEGGAGLTLAAAAAALGFLRWNWHPARIFLGDVGSVALGFLLGWLLLRLAAAGFWAPALILPLYYFADASITLVWRLARRAPVWQAHREHFYQRALGARGDHARVVRAVATADLGLVGLAVLALERPAVALICAVALVGGLLAILQRQASLA